MSVLWLFYRDTIQFIVETANILNYILTKIKINIFYRFLLLRNLLK